MNESKQRAYAFGGYAIDLANRELLANGREVKVQHRVFDLLVYLIENRDRAVSRDEIQEHVWAGRITTDAAIARVIMKARKAVGDDAHDQKMIKTLHGHGYRFVAPVMPVAASGELVSSGAGSVVSDPAKRSSKDLFESVSLGKAAGVIGVLLVLALGYFAVDKFLLDPVRDAVLVEEAAQQARDEILANADGGFWIAVLPLELCPAAADESALAGGIRAAIVNQLAMRDRIRIYDESVQHMADIGLTSDRMGELLQAQYLLHGELCRDDEGLELRAELTDRNQAIVWDADLRPVITGGNRVEQRLADRIASELSLLMGDVAGIEHRDAVNTRALELLRIAQFHRQNGNLEEASGTLEKALQFEPDFAEAVFEMAWVRFLQVRGSTDSYLEGIETAWPLADEALALALEEIRQGSARFEPYMLAAEILESMAWLKKEQTWRESAHMDEAEIEERKSAEQEMLKEAESYWRSAISLNRSNSTLYAGLAKVLAKQGPERRRETLEILEQARQTEPFDEQIAMQLAQNLALHGQYEQAMEELERFTALGEMAAEMSNILGEIQIDYGAWDDVAEDLLDALQDQPGKFDRGGPWTAGLYWFASDLPYLGLDAEAEALHQKLLTIPQRADATPWERWARQWFLLDKYRQATGRGEEVAREQLSDVEGLSNEEIVDRWFLRTAIIGQSFWVVGNRDRAIELFKALRHHRQEPRWAQRMPEEKMRLVRMSLEAGREAEAAPVLAELVEFLEVELASGVRHPKTLFSLASTYAAQGRHDEALEMLAKAVDYGCDFQGLKYVEMESGERFLWGVPWGTEWRDLEDDPRYQRQLSRQKALVDHRAANIRALLTTHDMDQLLAPVIEAHTTGR